MSSLGIYIKQRLSMGFWSLVALMLIVLSLKDLSISSFELYSFPFVLFFLLTLRLFDDLASAEIDKGRENRAYTNEAIKKELGNYLFVAQVVMVLTLSIFDVKRALFLLVFLVVNKFLYIIFYNKSRFRYFLPLLKYPFVIYLLSLDLSFHILFVYLAFIFFEMLEDQLFPGYLLEEYNIAVLNKKYVPYLFFLLFLLTHVILIYS